MSDEHEVDMTISSIWIEERVACPDRGIVERYVAGKLSVEEADYLRFHILEIGCPFCQASEEDLRLGTNKNPGEEGIRERLSESTSDWLRKKKSKK